MARARFQEVNQRNALLPVADVLHTGGTAAIVECAPASSACAFALFTDAGDYGGNVRTLADIAAECARDDETSERSLWRRLQRRYEAADGGGELSSHTSSPHLLTAWMQRLYADAATRWTVRKRFAIGWAAHLATALATGARSPPLAALRWDANTAQFAAVGAGVLRVDVQLDGEKCGQIGGERRVVSKVRVFSLHRRPAVRATLAKYRRVFASEHSRRR